MTEKSAKIGTILIKTYIGDWQNVIDSYEGSHFSACRTSHGIIFVRKGLWEYNI